MLRVASWLLPVLVVLACLSPRVSAQLFGPMEAPPENPLTDEKALLGKFLFWEEQLSSDDTTACGTCHILSAGGSDPRTNGPFSAHPGFDEELGTEDDAFGSIGVVARDCDGEEIDGDFFAPLPQVTTRRAPPVIDAGLAPELFWDGAADDVFFAPGEDVATIESGGALEVQSLVPILSTIEMGCVGRTWDDVVDKLEEVTPLALAIDMPQAMADALVDFPTYPDLFEEAFGDDEITPTRIAFALASYQRTLLADDTKFDQYLDGDFDVFTFDENAGLGLFDLHCMACHIGFELTDHQFRNTGVRPADEDPGRELVTGLASDAGKFKTPGLRNIALRAPYFHDGSAATLADVVEFYRRGGDFDDNLDSVMVEVEITDDEAAQIVAFLDTGLTDQRVVDGLPPFDHPTLRGFFRRGNTNDDEIVDFGDAIRLLEFVFLAEGELVCLDAGDVNDDGLVGVSDPIYLLDTIFQAGPPIPSPGVTEFGPDPTADDLECANEASS